MGRYKSCRGVVSTPTPHPNGYVPIGVDGKSYLIHRAIGVAFGLLTSLDDEREIDHVDNDPSNNNLANLRAVTRAKNVQHSHDTNANRAPHAGKQSKPIRGRKRGEKEWTAYASVSDARGSWNWIRVTSARCFRGGTRRRAGTSSSLRRRESPRA